MKRWLRRLDTTPTRRDIEEELSFHLDLLTEEKKQWQPSDSAARTAALEQFGNVDEITNECVAISKRRHPVVIALKLCLALVFLLGVLVRVFSPEMHVTRVGDILIFVGVIGRILLYLRTAGPARFLSNTEPPTTLVLHDKLVRPAALDRKLRTPLERIISNK